MSMKYGSLSKIKYGSNIGTNKSIKTKDFKEITTKASSNTSTIDREANKIINTYRPGFVNEVVTSTKFKTSKNSRNI
jgi:hypothetical protein